jgi:levanase
MALPRDVELVTTERGPRLVQQVVPEFAELERPDVAFTDGARAIAAGSETLPVEGDVVRIDAVIEPGDADAVGLSVLGDQDASTRIGWDAASARLFVDRRDSGNTGFHPAFASFDDAPVPLEDGRLALTVYVDRASVEVFADGGRTTITDQVFPNAGADAIGLWAEGGEAWLESLTVTPMHGAMYREAGADGATAAPPAAEVSALTGPRKGPDADGDYEIKVKVGHGEPTTVVRLVEDGRVIDREYRTSGSERTFSFMVEDASPGEHRYVVELENSAGVTDGGELLVTVAG